MNWFSRIMLGWKIVSAIIVILEDGKVTKEEVIQVVGKVLKHYGITFK